VRRASRPSVPQQLTSFSLRLDRQTRDMIRALCHEYNCAAAHLIRQLIRAEYLSLYEGARAPTRNLARPLDKDVSRPAAPSEAGAASATEPAEDVKDDKETLQ